MFSSDQGATSDFFQKNILALTDPMMIQVGGVDEFKRVASCFFKYAIELIKMGCLGWLRV